MRSTWKGYLRLSLVTCAVRLAPATSEQERISFHQINPKTGNRIKIVPHDAETGDEVSRADLVKGYEYDKGRYALIDKADLDRIKIDSTHTIDIERFVEAKEVDPFYFDSPYYVMPDGPIAAEAYSVIQAAMRQTDRIAMARFVLTSRERVVALQPHGKGISLTTLRAPEEVRDAAEYFEDVPEAKVTGEMLDLARSLIASKSGRFDPGLFTDRYQEELRKLVEAKVAGIAPHLTEEQAPRKVVDIMEALRRSVQREGGEPIRAANEDRRTGKSAAPKASGSKSVAPKRRRVAAK